jgi:hypothetical protein
MRDAFQRNFLYVLCARCEITKGCFVHSYLVCERSLRCIFVGRPSAAHVARCIASTLFFMPIASTLFFYAHCIHTCHRVQTGRAKPDRATTPLTDLIQGTNGPTSQQTFFPPLVQQMGPTRRHQFLPTQTSKNSLWKVRMPLKGPHVDTGNPRTQFFLFSRKN